MFVAAEASEDVFTVSSELRRTIGCGRARVAGMSSGRRASSGGAGEATVYTALERGRKMAVGSRAGEERERGGDSTGVWVVKFYFHEIGLTLPGDAGC
jgi:hypothetical protein